jgi:hypothetical protein
MTLTELCFPGIDAAGERGSIRWALFQHPAVTDVQLTARTDTLRIEHRGPADVQAWSATLVDAGFPAPHVVGETAPAPSDALHVTPA